MIEQLDFADFRSNDGAKRYEFCTKFVSTLKQYGFARLVNHGVSSSDIDKAFETSRRFFQLPLEQKLKSPHPPTANPHRGFSPIGLENVSAISNHDSTVPLPLLKDMKESYDIGSEQDELYSNIWPPSGVCDGFEPTFTSFFLSCYRAELVILEAISIGLGLTSQALSELHATQSNELRLTHYPAVSREEFSHSTRIAAHTDFGTITLLFQDSVGGLQVELPRGSGNFLDLESGGLHECILNVGDCLQRWTNLPSARHRVHLPEKPRLSMKLEAESIIDERFSIAYFGKPDRKASLRPLIKELELKDASPQYITAGEFQNMRIEGTYA